MSKEEKEKKRRYYAYVRKHIKDHRIVPSSLHRDIVEVSKVLNISELDAKKIMRLAILERVDEILGFVDKKPHQTHNS